MLLKDVLNFEMNVSDFIYMLCCLISVVDVVVSSDVEVGECVIIVVGTYVVVVVVVEVVC